MDSLPRARTIAAVVWLRVPEALLAALMAVLIAFMSVSVVSRYAFNIGLAWSDEAARLLFIWIVFVGFAVSVYRRANIGVEWFVEQLPRRLQNALAISRDVLIAGFSMFLTWQSFVTVRFAFLQRLPGLDISIAWMYMSVLVAGVLMTCYSLAHLWTSCYGSASACDRTGASAPREG
jgi:TRAP-type C4-dicarboxylate transport system permease small subunit